MSYLHTLLLKLIRTLGKKSVNRILEKPFLKKELSVSTNLDCIKFFNQGKIFNEDGEFFASIVHQQSKSQKLLNFFRSDKRKSYGFKITGSNGNTLASVHRSNLIWRNDFRVFDKNNKIVYTLYPKTKFNKLSFNILSNDEMHVAKIVGNASNTSFAMHNVFNHVIAIIHKKINHDSFCSTEYANAYDKNVLLATAICVGLYTGA
jgi:uncharacterized protein YxjI